MGNLRRVSWVKVVCVSAVITLVMAASLYGQGPAKTTSSPTVDVKEICDVLKGLEKNSSAGNATSQSIDTRLDAIGKSVAKLADRRGGPSAFDVILAVLTLVNSGAAVLLWITTRRQLGVTQGQLKVAQDQIELAREGLKQAQASYEQSRTTAIASGLQQLGANDRAVKSLLIEDPSIYGPLDPLVAPFGSRERPLEERKLKAYIGLVINHVKHIFLQRQLDQLPPGYWEAVDRDLDASIRVPQFREVWERVAPFQPQAFRDYIDGKVKGLEELQARGGVG